MRAAATVVLWLIAIILAGYLMLWVGAGAFLVYVMETAAQ